MTAMLRGGRGGPVEQTVRCPVCSHPHRVHNAAGCVHAGCECLEAHQPPGAPRVVVPEPPRRPQSAKVERLVIDGVDQVVTAATSPATVTTAPDPLDAALWLSARWYCPRCHQWPLDPGACDTCQHPLKPVYLVTLPRKVEP